MVITRHIAFQTKLLFTPIYSANRSFGTEQFYALMKKLLRVIDRQVNQCHRKIIASIFAIILTNVSVKTYTIISVKLHRH